MTSVTCAIILNNREEVFVAQRSSMMPCKWEFPGGKIEGGELLETYLEIHKLFTKSDCLLKVNMNNL